MAREIAKDCPSEILRALVEEHNKTVKLLFSLYPMADVNEMPREINVRQN